MMSATDTQSRLEELFAQPWSREVVADEDGIFVASVPELEGCFADGDTVEEALANLDQVLRDWLALALEEQAKIPEPRRQDDELFSGRFSVRVPRSLHRRLSLRAEAEGASLNQLIGVLLAQSIQNEPTDRPVEPSQQPAADARRDIREDIAADAVPATRSSIGALKGIATFFRDRGDINAASLLFAFAADRIATTESAEAASNDLGVTAALARRHGRSHLAEALWRESLRRNPSNLRSSSTLGQLLHHQGRYREAASYLELPSGIDNYALLFLGWSLFLDGRESSDELTMQRGRMCLVKALQNWSYQNRDSAQRESWLRHVRRLGRIPELHEEVEALTSFANANAGWPKIVDREVALGSDAVTDTAVENDSADSAVGY
jgi:antitoxin HicB